MKLSLLIILLILLTICCKKKEQDINFGTLQLISISVGPEQLSLVEVNDHMPIDQPIVIRFSQELDTSTVPANISLFDVNNIPVGLSLSYLDDYKTVSALPQKVLKEKGQYSILIGDELKGTKKENFLGLTVSFATLSNPLDVLNVIIDNQEIEPGSRIADISFNPTIEVHLSHPVSKEIFKSYTSVKLGSFIYNYTLEQPEDSIYSITVTDNLPYYRKIQLSISPLLSEDIGRDFTGLTQEFYTKLDSTDKFPRITDDQLLDLIQSQTFKYFWDFAHPTSGMIRDRNTSGDVVTTGGTGFGIMSIIVGIERNFITRLQGIERLETIINFLATADRFHGAWPHWLNGSTGKIIPFSTKDDGGDLVETAFLVEGLLTLRQYLNTSDTQENALITKINELWYSVEWNWYTQGGQNVLYWHWSPNYNWDMNHMIRGYNEALNTYILAKASPGYSISNEVYVQGWANSGAIVNGNQYYGYTLPLGEAYGGPLFYEHYSFVALDPRNLKDTYADYWNQAVNHALINRAYCSENPKNNIAYSADCWGLTASDNQEGYSAHSPTNDLGVISPTAAVSSLPYCPEQSMDAIRHFYYLLGDKLWGQYGFYDAFNPTEQWWASSYLAIDQGPMILMIENYRSGLLWNLFMSCPEITSALDDLGFTY